MRQDQINSATAGLAASALSHCGGKASVASIALVDAALCLVLAHHTPDCAIELVDMLAEYAREQVRAQFGEGATKQ